MARHARGRHAEPRRLRKYLKFAALCLVAGLALWWFARGMDWAKASEAMRHADWRLVALAVALICLTAVTVGVSS